MSEESVPVVKYIGHNVSKVRWKPQPDGTIGSSEIFASGSSEEEVNKVCMWHYKDKEGPEDTRSIIEPELICTNAVGAGVTDLCFLDERSLVASLENGGVVLLQYSTLSETLKQLQYWKRLHHLSSGESRPCTAVAVCGGKGGMAMYIVTGGEDGRITILRTSDLQPLTIFENADNSTVTALSYSMQQLVLSTSSSGQLKIWDLRSNTDRPVDTVEVPGDHVSLDSLDRHPHQPHVVAIGRGDGSLCFTDLRHHKRMVQLVQAHSAHVWEVKFDQSHPNNLFTCSQDGGLWHWDVNSSTSHHITSDLLPQATTALQNTTSLLPNRHSDRHTTGKVTSTIQDEGVEGSQTMKSSEYISPWLSGAVGHGNPYIQDYSPSQGLPVSVNSLDIESRHLLCCTDREALFVVPNLTLR